MKRDEVGKGCGGMTFLIPIQSPASNEQKRRGILKIFIKKVLPPPRL